MNAATRAVVGFAVAVAPADSRARLREQWAADLDGAAVVGMNTCRYAIGLVVAALRMRATGAGSRVAVGVLGTSALVITAGGLVFFASTHQPACATPRATLGVVPGTYRQDASGPLSKRARIAVHAVRLSGGYEGVWVDSDGGVKIGVWGPIWARARAAATAVATTPGPTITYVCQPTTAHRLAEAQNALNRSPLWQQHVIGFSSIDVKSATVTVGITDSAPNDTEATLVHDYGADLVVKRSSHPFVEMGPGRGRMPLAASENPLADRGSGAPARKMRHVSALEKRLSELGTDLCSARRLGRRSGGVHPRSSR